MPSDLLAVDPRFPGPRGRRDPALALPPVTPRDTAALANLYAVSYPPSVGAATMQEAVAEIEATFASEYGVLDGNASLLARLDGEAAGCVLVTERPVWGPDLAGPFIIDFFVAPQARGRGVGRGLLEAALDACARAGAVRVSLRIGEGTSSAALHLYVVLGFRPVDGAGEPS